MATTPGDEATVDFMLKRWQDPKTGLDNAWREEYKVYLSFPNKTNPNKVSVGKIDIYSIYRISIQRITFLVLNREQSLDCDILDLLLTQ